MSGQSVLRDQNQKYRIADTIRTLANKPALY